LCQDLYINKSFFSCLHFASLFLALAFSPRRVATRFPCCFLISPFPFLPIPQFSFPSFPFLSLPFLFFLSNSFPLLLFLVPLPSFRNASRRAFPFSFLISAYPFPCFPRFSFLSFSFSFSSPPFPSLCFFVFVLSLLSETRRDALSLLFVKPFPFCYAVWFHASFCHMRFAMVSF